jgi:hypothetical protein
MPAVMAFMAGDSGVTTCRAAFVVMVDAGAPVNGTTGDNFAGTGSLYVDSTAGVLYINTGAISNPTWVVVGTQS